MPRTRGRGRATRGGSSKSTAPAGEIEGDGDADECYAIQGSNSADFGMGSAVDEEEEDVFLDVLSFSILFLKCQRVSINIFVLSEIENENFSMTRFFISRIFKFSSC